jgi:hypothetical protein
LSEERKQGREKEGKRKRAKERIAGRKKVR